MKLPHRLDFTTDRLEVTHWRDQIADPVSRSDIISGLSGMLTPEVLRHLPATFAVGDAPDAFGRWIDERDAEADMFLITCKGDPTLLGLLILSKPEDEDTASTLHLGYLLARPSWGQGYATEMLSGLIDHLISLGDPVTLLGGVERGNEASARVLRKSGFTLAPDLSDDIADMFRTQLC